MPRDSSLEVAIEEVIPQTAGDLQDRRGHLL
jgi:hypothetical protein